MFYLHTSNRTENLVDALVRLISQTGSPSIFTRELFLVQSRGMEVMLSHYLSESFGVWSNGDYLLPLQLVSYLEQIMGRECENSEFDRELLVWRIESVLRDTSDPDLADLGRYLTGNQADLKRFQLSRQLANTFDQYQIMRANILEAWQKGVTVTDDPSERWQKLLWSKLKAQSSGTPHRGEAIQELIARLEQEEGLESFLPERIFVFGLHTMPPLFLSVIASLARRIDVHFFLLSPCELYWGDIESKKAQARRALKNYDQDLPEEMQVENLGYHSLLTSLGQQGAHFQELLLNYIDYYEEGMAGFTDPLDSGSSSLLHRLQSDILSGDQIDALSDVTVVTDDSLVINSCHSRMREMQVLKDVILDRLYKDPSLGLHDIIVMSPDIQDYAAMIPAVFSDIQHSIADRNTRNKNRFFDIFLQILGLFSGRYGWSEMVSILERPEVYPCFGLSGADLEKISFWVTDSGIRWGLSAAQRRDDGFVDIEAGSWRSGLERMLMGVAIESDTPVDAILPYPEIEGGDSEILGGLCQFAAAVEKARDSFAVDKTLADWSRELSLLCDTFFRERDHADLVALVRVIAKLNDDFTAYHNETVSLQVIISWLEGSSRTVTNGGFLSGRLTFCSMLPMRSIPFKLICLLGLNDGEYPKSDVFQAFDLMGKRYRHGDRSSRADDRYQFLEAIISARDCLYISYIGQSIKTNEKIPPSVVVTELLETIQTSYGVDRIVVEHPLQSSNSVYFRSGSNFFSYDENSCEIARTMAAGDRKNCVWNSVQLPEDEFKQIEYSEMQDFFKNPQTYFVQKKLEINLGLSEELPEDSEPFVADKLDIYLADGQILEMILENSDPRSLLKRLQAELRWPLGSPGALQFEKRCTDMNVFAQRLAGFDMGARYKDTDFEISLANRTLHGTLSHCYENGQLFYRCARLKGKDLLYTWLGHLVAGKARGTILPTYFLAEDSTVVFGHETGCETDLLYLMEHYLAGQRTPSELLVEPAFAYAQQVIRNRGAGRKSPLLTARELFQRYQENGYVAEWSLLYRYQNPEQILGEGFTRICEELMVPVWDHCTKRQEVS